MPIGYGDWADESKMSILTHNASANTSMAMNSSVILTWGFLFASQGSTMYSMACLGEEKM